MVNVIKANVNAILDGPVINVINFLVMKDALSMDSAEMVHAYVLGDGMVNTALSVSHCNQYKRKHIGIHFYICVKRMIYVCGL